MKLKLPLLIAGCLLAMQVLADTTPKTEKDKLSYSLGNQLGQSVKRNNIDLDADVFTKAIKDALTGAKPALSDEEMQKTVQAFQQKMVKQQQAMMQELAENNKKQGAAFLAENKKKPGVVTLPSGLQYKVVTAGKGPKPKANDTVVANYTGTLINGTEFDSSVKRGEPATFALNQVIKGWQEALQLMPVGSRWQVVIPASLAYGEAGAPPNIGPNETLVFDIELLSIGDKSGNNEGKGASKKEKAK